MRIQFASGRSRLPFSISFATTALEDGSTQPTTLWFAIAGENPAGVNLLSTPIQISTPSGKKLTITLPPDYKQEWESWTGYVIAASATNNPATFVQIGKIAVNDPLRSITFSSVEGGFKLSETIATPADLPANPVHGQLRAITSLGGAIYEYHQDAIYPPNGSTVLPSDDGGVWIQRPGSFSAYVANTADPGGCDRLADLVVPNMVNTPPYEPGQIGLERHYWLLNDSDGVILAGTRVGVAIAVDDVIASGAFDGLLTTRFIGYDNPTTGTRRTIDTDGNLFPNVGAAQLYSSAKSGLILPDDLQPGEAYTIALAPSFGDEAGSLADFGGTLSASPFLYQQIGNYNEAAGVDGDRLYAEFDRGLVTPSTGLSVTVGKRSGVIGNYVFRAVPATTISNLAPATADQQIIVNGNGEAYVKPAAYVRAGAEALRAIVSTAAGAAQRSPEREFTSDGTRDTIIYSLKHPFQETDEINKPAQVRPDYPDQTLAGKTVIFNAPFVTIYIRSGATIKRWANIPLTQNAFSTQNGAISDWDSGEIVAQMPAPAPEFSLFSPTEMAGALTTETAGGTTAFPAGILFISVAHQYDGSTVVSINHQAPNALPVGTSQYAWAESVNQSSIELIPRDEIIPWSTRRIYETGRQIIFDPASTAIANGITIWKPAFLVTSEAGRWMLDDSSAEILTGGNPPDAGQGSVGDVYFQLPSNANELTIYKKVQIALWGQVGVITGGSSGDSGTPSGTELKLTPIATPPATSNAELKVFVINDLLRLRRPGNGATATIATLNEPQTYTKAQATQTQAIAPASVISIDAFSSNSFSVNVDQATTIGNPVNLVNGGEYVLRLKQTGAGGFAVSFEDAWLFNAATPDLTSPADTLWLIHAHSDGANLFVYSVLSFTVAPTGGGDVIYTLVAHWTCDTFDTSSGFPQLIDSIGGIPIDVFGGLRSVPNSGIGGAIEFYDFGADYGYATSTINSLWVVGGTTSWKIEFRVKFGGFTAPSGESTFLLLSSNLQWEIKVDSATQQMSFACVHQSNTGQSTVTHAIALTTDDYYEVECKVDTVEGIISITVDGVMTTTPIVQTLRTQNNGVIIFGHQGDYVRAVPYGTFLDEVKFSRGNS